MSRTQRLGRLRWLCRRGMKELDLLFDGFVESHASELDTGAWPELETLLQTEDDQLWDWIQHPEKCTDQRFAQLLLEVQRAT